ncbi:MAG: glycosyltransferase family 2 protein [Porticoccus sp.]
MYQNKRIACIIPARDEAKAIQQVINGLQALRGSNDNPVIDDILVCDNGSTDDTANIALEANARVITQPQPGYGIACLTALNNIKNADILLFIDGDNAFCATQAIPLVHTIANGTDLAIGSRTLGHMEPGALTLPQRFGNQLASILIRWLWSKTVTDLGPFRAISQGALQQLAMEDERYGWTIEMQIKAIQQGMSIEEHSVDTFCRLGHSKISGTLRGTIGAGIGILSMIIKLRWRQFRQPTDHCRRPQKHYTPRTSLTVGGKQ